MKKQVFVLGIMIISLIFASCKKEPATGSGSGSKGKGNNKGSSTSTIEFPDSEVPEHVLSIKLSDGKWKVCNIHEYVYIYDKYTFSEEYIASVDMIVEENKYKALSGSEKTTITADGDISGSTIKINEKTLSELLGNDNTYTDTYIPTQEDLSDFSEDFPEELQGINDAYTYMTILTNSDKTKYKAYYHETHEKKDREQISISSGEYEYYEYYVYFYFVKQ